MREGKSWRAVCGMEKGLESDGSAQEGPAVVVVVVAAAHDHAVVGLDLSLGSKADGATADRPACAADQSEDRGIGESGVHGKKERGVARRGAVCALREG